MPSGPSERTSTSVSLILLSILTAGLVRAAAPPETVEVRLRPVRWQALPDAVHAVYVGPDQRVWYELFSANPPKDAAELKRRVESQFDRRAPQLDGATPLLFEPGGRVWFRGWGVTQQTIFGYDGKQWTERQLQADHALVANVPNHGRRQEGLSNAFIDGTAFFIDAQGIECFDGRAWTYKEITPKREPWPALPLLVAEMDGKGAIVLMRRGESSVLCRWRGGAWSELPSPGKIGSVRGIAARKDGLWLLEHGGVLRFHPFDPARGVAALLDGLADPDPKARERASAELTAMGPTALPEIEKRLTSADDPEAIRRLQAVAVALRDPKPVRGPGQSLRVGPYTVSGVGSLVALSNGWTYMAALQVAEGDAPPEPGVVFVRPDGTFRAEMGDAALRAWDRSASEARGPIAVGKGRAWLPPSYKEPTGLLLDLETGKTVAELPVVEGYRWLQAAKDDGTLFVSRGATTAASGAIFAFSPSQPDDVSWIDALPHPIAGRGFGIASDGSVFALQAGGAGLVRFDGKQWNKLPAFEKQWRSLGWCLAGAAGQMLFKGDRTCAFLDDQGRIFEEADLAELIKANRDAIVKAFPPSSRGNGCGSWTALTSDSGGNLWLLDELRLRVLVGDRWEDPTLALKAIGSPVGTVRYMSAVGDGGKVYVADFERSGRTCSALGEVRGGAIVFVRAPVASEASLAYLNVREPGGALWVPAAWAWTPAGNGALGSRFPQRVTEKGSVQQVEGLGWPRLADDDGNVWFAAENQYGRFKKFTIWRDGKVTAEVPFSGNERTTRLFADGPGRVIVWTPGGVQRFVARDKDKPADFKPGTAYGVRGIDGFVGVKYSRSGFFVVSAEAGASSHDRKLLLVPVPK